MGNPDPFLMLKKILETIVVRFLHQILTIQRSVATTHPFNVVHTIYLLVLRVRTIITRSDW